MIGTYLRENQLSISINFSEAKINSIEKNDSTLILGMLDVEMLCNFKTLDFFSPDIPYRDWIAAKYFNPELHSEQFEHIRYLEKAYFKIENPKFYYNGDNNDFINMLSTYDNDITHKLNYSYHFGGVLNNSFDEFEICTNEPLLFIYDLNVLKKSIEHFKKSDIDFQELNPDDIERNKKIAKLKRKKLDPKLELFV